MPLSDTAIRRAKPEAKPVKMRDGAGLYLLLRPDGARWWCWDYRRPVTGKRNTLSLGTSPEVGLADAREKHAEARRHIETADPQAGPPFSFVRRPYSVAVRSAQAKDSCPHERPPAAS
jgi:hypothetical protein